MFIIYNLLNLTITRYLRIINILIIIIIVISSKSFILSEFTYAMENDSDDNNDDRNKGNLGNPPSGPRDKWDIITQIAIIVGCTLLIACGLYIIYKILFEEEQYKRIPDAIRRLFGGPPPPPPTGGEMVGPQAPNFDPSEQA